MLSAASAWIARISPRFVQARRLLSIASVATPYVQGTSDPSRSGRRGRGKRKKKRGFVAFPFAYREEVDIYIHDLTNLGVGVGRVNISERINTLKSSINAKVDGSTGVTIDGEGEVGLYDDMDEDDVPEQDSWVVFVPKSLPGETVKARVFRNMKSYSEADLITIQTASPDRVTPQCEYFEDCGGCQYQMMTLSAQRRWKQKQVQTLLQRIGNIETSLEGEGEAEEEEGGVERVMVNPCLGTEHDYHYRSKITPHYNSPHNLTELKIGFQKRGTRIIRDIAQCIIATPAINRQYAETRQQVYNTIKEQGIPKKGATLLFREGEKMDNDTNTLALHVETDFRQMISQTVQGITFSFKAGEFFQNNAYVLPVMVDKVISLLTGDNVEYLIDAYCGSGLFSLTSSQHFKATYGVEISELAVEAAKHNACINNIENSQFLCAKSEAIFELPELEQLDKDKTVILLDPPRKGCDELFLNQLFAFRPKKIVYVSCDPSTQARDSAMIIDAGYKIIDVTPVDLFPQTRHIENIIAFIRE